MRMIRYVLLPIAKQQVINSQYGAGVNGGDTAIGHLSVRCVAECSAVLDMSVAILFLETPLHRFCGRSFLTLICLMRSG